MIAVLTIVHVLNCIALIFVVLLQAGRGAGLAGVFGASGGGGGAVFGGRGAGGFLSKATAALAVVFMITSVTLSIFSGRRSTPKSVLMEEARRSAQEAMQRSAPTGGAIPGGAESPGLPPLDLSPGGQQESGGEAPAEAPTPTQPQSE